jgi:hypothetical protein
VDRSSTRPPYRSRLDRRFLPEICRPRWVIADDDQGAGPIIDQGSKTLTGKQVAFDTEMIAIEEALEW